MKSILTLCVLLVQGFQLVRSQDTAIKVQTSHLPYSKQPETQIEAINFDVDYETITRNYFSMPINDENFHYIFKKVKLDRSSLLKINQATFRRITTSCISVRGQKDQEIFLDDFTTSYEKSEVYNICFSSFINLNGNTEKFCLIKPENSDRIYLITYKLENTVSDFFKTTEAVLIRDKYYGKSSIWGFERKCTLYNSQNIEVSESCYYDHKSCENKTIISLGKDGKINMKLAFSIRSR